MPRCRSYGALSNEALLLQFGFVPSPALHGDASAALTLPERVFSDALRRGDADDTDAPPRTPALRAAREALLRQAGALGMGPDEEALFELVPGEAPVALLAVAGVIMLRSSTELALYEGGAAAAAVDGALRAAHAARARAFAGRLLRAAAREWCGAPGEDDPAGLLRREGDAGEGDAGGAAGAEAYIMLQPPAGAGGEEEPLVAVPTARVRAAAALRLGARAVFACAAAAAEHGGARVPLRLDGEEEESDDGA
jgi:hypothetical protein